MRTSCGHNLKMGKQMSALYKNFATNENTEVSGFWYTVTVDDDGKEVKFLLARKCKRNKAYGEAVTRILNPYQQQIQLETVKPELLNKLLMEAFIEGCVKNWENVADENGNILSFSKSAAMKLFRDIPDLYELLNKEADKAANYHNKTIEAAVKN